LGQDRVRRGQRRRERPECRAAAPPAGAQRHLIERQGHKIAELWTSADADPTLFARVAVIVSPYCARL
jgi:hypothetical protein